MARDFGAEQVDNFFASSAFARDFRLEGDKIKTVKEI